MKQDSEQKIPSTWELSVFKLKFGRLTNSQNCCFLVKNDIFHLKFHFLLFWLNWFFFTPKCEIWIQNWISRSLKSVARVFFKSIFIQKFRKCKNCYFTDFDTSSVLQINCSNTYRVSRYVFAAIDCQNEIM